MSDWETFTFSDTIEDILKKYKKRLNKNNSTPNRMNNIGMNIRHDVCFLILAMVKCQYSQPVTLRSHK